MGRVPVRPRRRAPDAPVLPPAAAPDAGRLWVPFRDEPNGEKIYGAGRYLDLDPDEHRVAGGWVLDCNAAYSPTCAYNHAYECPLVPVETRLDVRIEAGERAFPGDPVAPPDG